MTVLSTLRSRLASTDDEVRRNAVASLDGGEEALMLIIEALGDPSWRVRKEAVSRVASWRSPDRAAEALTQTLAEPENIGRRNAAIDGLSRLGSVALGPLISALDRRPQHRKLVIDALGALGDARAVPPLGRALDDPDENVRVAAAEALGKLGTPTSLAQLERGLARGELMLSLACLEALTRHGAAVSVSSLLPLLSSPALRPAVVEALGASGDPAALSHVTASLAAPTRGVRNAALNAIVRLYKSFDERNRRAVEEVAAALPNSVEQALIEMLREPTPLRAAAIRVLGMMRRPGATRAFVMALGEPELEELATEALLALGDAALAPLCNIVPELEGMLRAKVFLLMPRLVSPGTPLGPLPRLRAILGAALDDEDQDVATAAAQALRMFSGESLRRARTPVELKMNPSEFDLIRDVINQHCGLLFEPDAKFLLEKRLSGRVEALGLKSFNEYYRYLRRGEDSQDEFDEIVQRLTTNETYFFRERYQLDAFQYEILPAIHSAQPRGKRLSVWSAGCATGEEAYTIAMLVLETGLFHDWDVKIAASDISRRVLALARRGRYGRSSFRQTEDELLRRYFRPVDGRHEVRDEVRRLVDFFEANLLEESALARVDEVDVIFCRNVLMYFDAKSRKQVIDSFYRKLVRGGLLLLGHTESLINLSTSFELVRLEHDMVYRKP